MTNLIIFLLFVLVITSVVLSLIAMLMARDAKKTSRRTLREVKRYLIASGHDFSFIDNLVTAEKSAFLSDKKAALSSEAGTLTPEIDSTSASVASDESEALLQVAANLPAVSASSTLPASSQFAQNFDTNSEVDYIQKMLVSPKQEADSKDTLKSLVEMSSFFGGTASASTHKE